MCTFTPGDSTLCLGVQVCGKSRHVTCIQVPTEAKKKVPDTFKLELLATGT